MDPIGFGLENYDGIGAYRTMDGTDAIDASGALPDGRAFTGRRELAQLIAADPAYASCFTSKLYSYALGRLPEITDKHLYRGRSINWRRDTGKTGCASQTW